jgi:selenocysteine-specific elongation factor
MFVVAADDGLMPQSREHLTILDLLEVRHGLVALTKIDRVPEARVAEVRADIEQLLAATTLAGMPVFPLSAHTGEGLPALQAYLRKLAIEVPPRAPNGNFRLAVDRSFHIEGAGLVVTGTVVAGSVAVGDQAHALIADSSVRVRDIHAQNAKAGQGHVGQRCALNLAGVAAKAAPIERGDWIVKNQVPGPVTRLDARVRVPTGESALKHWMPIHVHLGASDVTGRVVILDAEKIEAGAAGLVQLVLDHPIGAVHGDRLILRDQSARRTIAGGRTIDVFPPLRGRSKPARLAQLRAIERADPAEALEALLQLEALGVDLARYCANRNLTDSESEKLFASVKMRKMNLAGASWGIWPDHWETLCKTALDGLAAALARSADTPGIADAHLFDDTGTRLTPELALAVGEELVRQGRALRTGNLLRLPGHQAQFNPVDLALWEKIEHLIDLEPARPPTSAEIAAQLREIPKRVQALLETAARRRLVWRVADKRFFRQAEVHRLAEIVQGIAEQSADHRVTPVAFRDQSGLGRNLSIEVLEFFDRIGFTRRLGDSRLVLRPAGESLDKSR